MARDGRAPTPRNEFKLALRDAAVPPRARLTGLALESYMNAEGVTYVGQRTLCDVFGIGRKRLAADVAALVEAGLIEVRPRARDKGATEYRAVRPARSSGDALPITPARSSGDALAPAPARPSASALCSSPARSFERPARSFDRPARSLGNAEHQNIRTSSSSGGDRNTNSRPARGDDDERTETVLRVLACRDRDRAVASGLTIHAPVPWLNTAVEHRRTLDGDRVRQLVVEHPDWAAEQVADAVEPGAPPPAVRTACDECGAVGRCTPYCSIGGPS